MDIQSLKAEEVKLQAEMEEAMIVDKAQGGNYGGVESLKTAEDKESEKDQKRKVKNGN